MGAANKKKKQAIQERQKKLKQIQNPISNLNQNLQAHVSELCHELSLSRREVSKLKGSESLLNREVLDQRRKLKAREALTADMHNTHVVMKESLHNIRKLHQHAGDYVCKECGKEWPCETYSLIKSPEHVAVTSLLEMQRELSRRESDAAQDGEDRRADQE